LQDERRPPSVRGNAWTIVLLGALCIVSPFAVDMYLPAFASIAKEFGTTTSQISLSLSSYFVGFSIGQMLYGPLLDRYGRKPPLYFGLTAFVLCSIGCASLHDLHALIALRFLQALGACVAQVAAIAMVKDFFPARESAKVFSLLFLMIGVSPLLAPTIGSLLITAVGWRWIFFALAALATVILVSVLFLLPEPHAPDHTISLRPGPMLHSFWNIARDPQFMTYTLAGGFSFAGLISFVSGSPILFIDGYGLSPRAFGMVFAVLVMGFIGGNQANVVLLKRITSQRIFRIALMAQMVTGVLFLTGTYLHAVGLYSTLLLFFIFLSCIGLTYPNSAAIALAPFAHHAGRASALLGFLQMGVGALISTGIGVLGAKSVVWLLSCTGVVAWIVLMFGAPRIGELVEGDDSVVVVH
jgi:DHA1 family bicyclomycin/chloramphenicol resistance-like MFS transporter